MDLAVIGRLASQQLSVVEFPDSFSAISESGDA
jgi:hypothetical protein